MGHGTEYAALQYFLIPQGNDHRVHPSQRLQYTASLNFYSLLTEGTLHQSKSNPWSNM